MKNPKEIIDSLFEMTDEQLIERFKSAYGLRDDYSVRRVNKDKLFILWLNHNGFRKTDSGQLEVFNVKTKKIDIHFIF